MTKEKITEPKDEAQNFEKAFARLEEILDKMNSGEVSLDESLKLYEEADKLINSCGKRLNEAERKIQILIKNRNGELSTNSDGTPMVENFRSQTE